MFSNILFLSNFFFVCCTWTDSVLEKNFQNFFALFKLDLINSKYWKIELKKIKYNGRDLRRSKIEMVLSYGSQFF
jgi:hypothetical protein